MKVLGRGQKWSGGDYTTAPGGGQKVRLLKEALQEMESEDQVLLFTDRYGGACFIRPKLPAELQLLLQITGEQTDGVGYGYTAPSSLSGCKHNH